MLWACSPKHQAAPASQPSVGLLFLKIRSVPCTRLGHNGRTLPRARTLVRRRRATGGWKVARETAPAFRNPVLLRGTRRHALIRQVGHILRQFWSALVVEPFDVSVD